MNYKEIKRKLDLTDADVGEMFGYKNYPSYYNSSRRKHVENGIIKLYELMLSKGQFLASCGLYAVMCFFNCT